MKRRAVLALLVIVAAALVAGSPAHAAGALYVVTGTGDEAGTCGPYPGVPGVFACTTLRAAVASSGSDDVVGVPSGVYTLTQGALAITKDTIITGGDPHTTFIEGNGSDRAITVGAGAAASISGVTIRNGRAPVEESGGNILNEGTLVLFHTRVSGGNAETGGGISSSNSLQVLQSLIDGNTAVGQGGGIANFGGTLEISDSTLFDNVGDTAAAILAVGDGGQLLELDHATIAFNDAAGGSDPGGIAINGGTWTSFGSLLVSNRGDNINNCSTPADLNSAQNIEDDSSCGFAANNVSDTGLPRALSEQGGYTPVLAISPTGTAKDFVSPCGTGFDQRFATRDSSGRCDAGAYEEGASAPDPTPFQVPVPPTPTPTTPAPVPTPTPTPTATPVAGKSVAGTVVEGKVLVKTPGGKFVALDPGKPIPNGSTIDTKKGTIEITAQQKAGAPLQKAKFFDGIFKITQTKKTTDLTLNEALAKCPKKHSAHAAAKKKKPKTRKLWGDGSGSFRTRGQYSAATVRGTKWLVQDSCAGTLTRVKKGVVNVRDNVRRKTIVLRAGKKYLAKPRR